MHEKRQHRHWHWYFDLLRVLLHKELTVRYKGSLLGFLWSLMNPLALAGVYYIVFGIYMRFNTPHYLITLLAALFPWQWFANSINQGPFLFLSNPTLVKKVAFPRQAIPLVINMQDMVHFFMSLPVFLAFKLLDGLYPAWNWLWGIPLLSLITLLTVYGACLFTGTINLFFRDLGNLVTIAVNILFFATPIFYTLAQVPMEYISCFKWNPVAPMFICWRDMLMDNSLTEEYLLLAIFYSILSFVIGIITYLRFQKKFAEVM
ncbi:MAG: ABC transporter permease [Acidobacteria bacterium]|nr:MAG: ABC transporter permease [Acidobacteriota bacterium]